MARFYRVSVQPNGKILRFKLASTQTDARDVRNELMNDFNCKKSDITIEQVEIPITKHELLIGLNEMINESYEAGVLSGSDED